LTAWNERKLCAVEFEFKIFGYKSKYLGICFDIVGRVVLAYPICQVAHQKKEFVVIFGQAKPTTQNYQNKQSIFCSQSIPCTALPLS
jgi:hypothetical protein